MSSGTQQALWRTISALGAFAQLGLFGLAAWIAIQFVDFRSNDARFAVEIAAAFEDIKELRGDIDKLEQTFPDRYTGAEAQIDWERQNERDVAQDNALLRLNQEVARRIDRVEDRVFPIGGGR